MSLPKHNASPNTHTHTCVVCDVSCDYGTTTCAVCLRAPFDGNLCLLSGGGYPLMGQYMGGTGGAGGSQAASSGAAFKGLVPDLAHHWPQSAHGSATEGKHTLPAPGSVYIPPPKGRIYVLNRCEHLDVDKVSSPPPPAPPLGWDGKSMLMILKKICTSEPWGYLVASSM